MLHECCTRFFPIDRRLIELRTACGTVVYQQQLGTAEDCNSPWQRYTLTFILMASVLCTAVGSLYDTSTHRIQLGYFHTQQVTPSCYYTITVVPLVFDTTANRAACATRKGQRHVVESNYSLLCVFCVLPDQLTDRPTRELGDHFPAFRACLLYTSPSPRD